MSIRDKLLALERQAELGGGVERIARQHRDKKLTARERLELCDGSLVDKDHAAQTERPEQNEFRVEAPLLN